LSGAEGERVDLVIGGTMTRQELKTLQEALDKATTALGVAGEASTMGKSKDAERALKEAVEELNKCRQVLARTRVEKD
jgi:multidrug resistance efflux pump